MKKVFFLLLCILSPFELHADSERNALSDDIVGNWVLVDLPSALQPKFLKTNPWPATCQWFSYAKTGELKTFDKFGPNMTCENLSSSQIDKIVEKMPAVISWKYNFSAQFQKGLLIISRSDVQNYGEVWEPHLVTEAYTNSGAEFLPGDLNLYLVDLKMHQIVWIRHLRRAQ